MITVSTIKLTCHPVRAKRLKESITCLEILAHLEASEFAIILKPVEQKQNAINIAESILDIISQPMVLEGYKIYITASIGITFYPLNDITVDGLLKNASAASSRIRSYRKPSYAQ